MKESPSMDLWLKEAKSDASAEKCGMYLVHNGVVRKDARSKVRNGDENAKDVCQMHFSYDKNKVDAATAQALELEGIYFIKTWLNDGILNVGDDIMYVMVGGDIRPHVIDALQYLVGKIKNECVTEQEVF